MMYSNGGMFGGMYGGNVNAIPGMGWGGYNQYQAPAPTPFPPSAQPRPDYGSRFGAPTWPLRNPPQYPQTPGGVMEQDTPGTGNPGPQVTQDGGNDSVGWQPRGGGYQSTPMMSPEFQSRPPAMDPGRNMVQRYQPQGGMFSAPGFAVNQRVAGPQPQPAPQQQSFEQYAATLGNSSGMTSGQMQDAYQKSLQPASTNFWQNTGVGTQRPQGFTPPPAWGQQTYGFDPRAMAGKQVGRDMGWYYGMDSVGRTVNQAGNAVPSFGAPADGLGGRSRPWFR